MSPVDRVARPSLMGLTASTSTFDDAADAGAQMSGNSLRQQQRDRDRMRYEAARREAQQYAKAPAAMVAQQYAQFSRDAVAHDPAPELPEPRMVAPEPAPAPAAPAAAGPSAASLDASGEAIDHLQSLAALHQHGILTDGEFATLKARVLA